MFVSGPVAETERRLSNVRLITQLRRQAVCICSLLCHSEAATTHNTSHAIIDT